MFFSKRKEERSKREDVSQKVLTKQLNTDETYTGIVDMSDSPIHGRPGELLRILRSGDMGAIKKTVSNMSINMLDYMHIRRHGDLSIEVLDCFASNFDDSNVYYTNLILKHCMPFKWTIGYHVLCRACEEGNIEMFEKYKTYDYLSIGRSYCDTGGGGGYTTITPISVMREFTGPFFNGREIEYKFVSVENTPIFLAIKNGHVDIISCIFDYIDFDKINNKFIVSELYELGRYDEIHAGILKCMLTHASEHNHLNVIEYFVENLCVDVEKHGAVAGIIAMVNRNDTIFDYLIKHGLNVEATLPFPPNRFYWLLTGASPLTDRAFSYLLDNYSYLPNELNRLMVLSIERNDLQKLKILNEKSELNIHHNDGVPLREASSKGFLDIVKYLVDKGADVHASNDKSVQLASINGHVEVVKYLVENGADIHAGDDIALKMATRRNRKDVIEYIESLEKLNDL